MRVQFQRQSRRRNSSRNWRNWINRKKLSKRNIKLGKRNLYLRRSGKEENNPKHRCLMGKKELQHWSAKGYNRGQIVYDFGKAVKHLNPHTSLQQQALFFFCGCHTWNTAFWSGHFNTQKLLVELLITKTETSKYKERWKGQSLYQFTLRWLKIGRQTADK